MDKKCSTSFSQYYAWLSRATDLERKIEENDGGNELSALKKKRFESKLKKIEEKIQEYEEQWSD